VRPGQAEHAEHLVITTLLVAHAEHAYRPAAGESGFSHEDQRVQRVAIRTETVLDETIVSRVLGGGEQGAISLTRPVLWSISYLLR
jgi:hypothetical protein